MTATEITNGERDGDFSWTTPGELVMFGQICDDDLRDPDGACGCGRAFAGLSSHRSTTTALVEERDLTEADLRLAVRSSLEDGGWIDPAHPCCGDPIVDESVDLIHRVAKHFPTGVVLGTRVGVTFVRGHPGCPNAA